MTSVFTVRFAWRNVWRQKRRTLLTAGAVGVAMALSLFLRSMQEGSYAHNLDTATRFYSGYLQLQHPDFAENQSIDELLPADDGFVARIRSIDGLTTAVPRLESFALGSVGPKSKGVVVMGVDPEGEDGYSGLASRVKKGRYFARADEKTALVGGRLADYFGLEPGDELVLYGQGFHGVTAAGLFTVAGVLRFPTPRLDARLVYLPLKTAQNLYGTGNRVTSWVLHGDDVAGIPALEASARARMGPGVRVRDWADLSPELAQQIALDRASGQFLVLVLYGIVGFSLFATLVMMTLERQREFGVLLATGMGRGRLQCLVAVEALFLALAGVALGLAVIVPLLLWFHAHPIRLTGQIATTMTEMGFEPILPFSLAPRLFVGQVLAVLVLSALCLIFPLARVGRLSVAAALKG